MRTDAFDFELPQELIALRPAEPRVAARLLLIDGMNLQDGTVGDLPTILGPGDLVVVNDTKVIPARLLGERQPRQPHGPAVRIECLLHRRLDGERYEAFVRPAKRLRDGDIVSFAAGLRARIASRSGEGLVVLLFERSGAALDAAIAGVGEMPLPPYIAGRRRMDARDILDYQTVYAREPGAVAAPTAGLHLSDGLLASLESRGVARVAVTLHVGAGTFLPVKALDTDEHVMHAEWGTVSASAAEQINAARAAGGRIVAIGTTTLRILESACDSAGRIQPFAGDTRIFIVPGCSVRSVDLLFTNFHLPRSTLLMLVQAFGGIEALRAAYAHAINARYRFYSYGDACLITRGQDG